MTCDVCDQDWEDDFTVEDALDAIFTMSKAWLSMLDQEDTYEQRKVDRYETEELFISTAHVIDSRKPYETAIAHPAYNEGAIVIVQMYDNIEDAQAGHDKWVQIMTADKLPDYLTDANDSELTDVKDKLVGKSWRIKYKERSI